MGYSEAMTRKMQSFRDRVEVELMKDLDKPVTRETVHDVRKGLSALGMLWEHMGYSEAAPANVRGTEAAGATAEHHYHHSTPVATAESHTGKRAGEFCHEGHCDTEADAELDRILRSRDDVIMERLSNVLSEHFSDVAAMHPAVYAKLLRDLRAIRV